MPMIRIQTSIAVDEEKQTTLMNTLSSEIAELLGKPESYMMIILEPETVMMMSGTAEAAALVEVRSVGSISEEEAKNLSGKISEIMGKEIGVGAGRIYLNMQGVPGVMWGFDGRTFG